MRCAVNRCPFVRAVAEGRLDDAKAIALAGPEPADDVVVPVLVGWATEAAEQWLAVNV